MRYIPSRRKLSRSGLLYVILDTKIIKEAHRDIFSLADNLAKYGVDFLQLRTENISDKTQLQLSLRLAKIIHKRKKYFIINNRADIAFLSGADGLHLGSDDISAQQAKKILPQKAIIGKTVHNLIELKSLSRRNIDYVSIGPVFKTEVKPTLPALGFRRLQSLIKQSTKLTFAIGGINLYNIKTLVKMGVKNIVVCRGIILQKDIKLAIKQYKECLRRAF